MTTSTPRPQVDRAEIRQAIFAELDALLIPGWQKDFNGNAVIDAAVKVAAARELVSRQEIDRLRAENARLKADVAAYKAALDMGEELLVIGEYLCQKVDACTCGADLNAGYGHEPYCGVEPVAKLARVRAALGVSETPEACDE